MEHQELNSFKSFFLVLLCDKCSEKPFSNLAIQVLMQMLKKLGCFQLFSYDKIFKHLEPKFHKCTFQADNNGHMY